MGFGLRVVSTSGTFLGAIGVLYAWSTDKKTVYASWTTNFTPSVKWDDNWDKRNPKFLVKPRKNEANNDKDESYQKELEKARPKASRNLFLIRHGQYMTNGLTDSDRYLTELGRMQAKITGQRLKDLGYSFNKIVVSTMTRAIESAQLISSCLPGVPVENCELLREGAPIPPEPPIGHWQPEASQFHEDGARIEAAFRKHLHRADPSQVNDSYEVMVCHANVIRYFVCRALQLPPEAWLRFSLNHSSITWLVIRPSGRVVLKSFGDSGHFPAEKISLT